MSQQANVSKKSKIVPFIISTYPLVMVGALIAVGVHFVNYTASWSTGNVTEIEYPIVINASQTFTFHLSIAEIPPYTGSCFFEENNTFCDLRKFSKPTLNRWEIVRVKLWFEKNETIDIWFTSYNTKGNVIQNVTFQEAPRTYMVRGPYELSQPETYTFEMKNNYNTQSIHFLLHIYIDEWIFEKPYFYYGILELIIAIIYPLLFLTKIFKIF